MFKKINKSENTPPSATKLSTVLDTGQFVNIEEKTYITGTRRWYYTYIKVRSAYLSLVRTPLPFNTSKKPELDIPNTTNSLNGSFAI